MTVEFKDFGKIPRLNRDIIVTEKIDGTNAQVYIHGGPCDPDMDTAVVLANGDHALIRAGSRYRWLAPGKEDNFGFAGWVREHADELAKLGPGRHFGEWWGKGIQRGYGLSERRFSLFKVSHWNGESDQSGQYRCVQVACCHVVPILYHGPRLLPGRRCAADEQLTRIRKVGSYASADFMYAEGIIVYHTASGRYYKATLDGDGLRREYE